MEALFQAISKVERWLRQQYSTLKIPPQRVFWNQIMVTMGSIMLSQQGLSITQSNLERYTPIPGSSIYRTLELLTQYKVLQKVDTDSYDFKSDLPKDISELTTSRMPINMDILFEEFKKLMKKTVQESLMLLDLKSEQIEEVTSKIDTVQPEKDLTELESMFGEGSFI